MPTHWPSSGRQLGQSALRGDGTEGTGVLCEEDVGRARPALLEDGRGEVGRAGVLDLDIDVVRGLELLDERADQLLAAAGVDRQRAARGLGRGGRR
jgi:hypothetical protein